MIYIIGDRHGMKDGFSEKMLPGQSAWTADDTVIVTGDFGYVMYGEENVAEEKATLNMLEKKPYTILFCDGNHEGFDYLEQYPEERRYGAPVRKIRNNIYWLQRGYIYTINEKTFFVMGGAYSIDKDFRLSYQALTGDKIWFAQELPTAQEYHRAIQSLKAHDHKVDYIITHTAPKLLIPRLIGKFPDHHDLELTGFLDWVDHEVSYQHWYFGHFHLDEILSPRFVACYQQIHNIPETSG